MINIDFFNVVVHYWSFQGDVELRGEVEGEVEDEVEDEVEGGVKVYEVYDSEATT